MTEPCQPTAGQSNHQLEGKQRFLIVSSLFPPDILGGAETCAYNQAIWLRDKGFEVGVLTTAKTPQEASGGTQIEGIKIWRVWMPRQYSMFASSKAKAWQKPLWHLQDHFDPRNKKIVAQVLQDFGPDYINIHLLQGIGYNALAEMARSGIPTTFFLHDLSLACLRMGMFIAKTGTECASPCTICKLSALYKEHCVNKFFDIRFCSPSNATLEKLSLHFPVKGWPHACIMNANKTPAATISRVESERVRFLYAGRLHTTKGVDVLLEAASALASLYDFTLTVLGTGPEEERLREKYGHLSWCSFKGFVPQQEVSNHIVNSDVLCLPSIWAENSPGIVIHALSEGLPVIGSDKAGIPELVKDGKNGFLAPAGDVAGWRAILEKVLKNPALLTPLRQYALENASRFDQDHLGEAALYFMRKQNH